MYQAQFLDVVASDIKEAKKWYKEQQEGLEVKFALAVEQAILKMLKMPTAYAIRYKNIRIVHTKIFPYNIHFFINEEKRLVVITGIVFNRRQDALRPQR